VVVNGTRNGNIVTVRVRSQRGATRLSLMANGATVRRVNGVTPPPPRRRPRDQRGWQYAAANGVDEMVVELAATGPVEVVASDVTHALPPAAAPLLRARQAALATPIQDGDSVITRAWSRW
jgi:hypothetical protein